ncbi:hypothetical protein CBM2591_A320120 [Cupriavidus taiwanensis]|nr:hypothetical protein CBM2591_A320120 [Cupriavidus taiwanensis]SPD44890.1 protein of unknown function [Cupriavidus taiwanensis]
MNAWKTLRGFIEELQRAVRSVPLRRATDVPVTEMMGQQHYVLEAVFLKPCDFLEDELRCLEILPAFD